MVVNRLQTTFIFRQSTDQSIQTLNEEPRKCLQILKHLMKS